MTDNHERQRLPAAARVGLVLAVLVAGYFVVMAAVRRHVTGRIDASIGRTLPPFALATVDGGRLDSRSLAGKRVVLNFFRSRCHACAAESGAIRALAAELRGRDDVVLIGVLLDRVMGFGAAETEATLARYRYHHPIAIADAAFVDAFHGVGWSRVTPVTYVVDAAGRIERALRGAQDLADLRQAALPPAGAGG